MKLGTALGGSISTCSADERLVSRALGLALASPGERARAANMSVGVWGLVRGAWRMEDIVAGLDCYRRDRTMLALGDWRLDSSCWIDCYCRWICKYTCKSDLLE